MATEISDTQKDLDFFTVYNPLYDITEYFIPNPQHSKTVKSGSLKSEIRRMA